MLDPQEPPPTAAPPQPRFVLLIDPAYTDPGSLAAISVRAVQGLAAGLERDFRRDPLNRLARFQGSAYRGWLRDDAPIDVYTAPQHWLVYGSLLLPTGVPYRVCRRAGHVTALLFGPVPPEMAAPLVRQAGIERLVH